MTSIVDAAAVPVHVRVGHRRPPGQALRPGQRRHPRRDHPRGPRRARRLRDGDDDGPRARPRRDHDEDLRRLPAGRPRHGPRHRLHEGRLRLRLPDLRHAGLRQGPVAGHREGVNAALEVREERRCRSSVRRPGDDVRVRVPRDAGADAAARSRWRIGWRAGSPRSGKLRPAAVPPSGRQDPGHGRVRARSCPSGSGPSSSPRSTTRTSGPSGSARTSSRRSSCAVDPGRAAAGRPGDARQPDRPVRDRRPDGRRRPDRPQDHRRHLRRDGASRRRRVHRQGPDEGRPVRRRTRPAGWRRTSSPPGSPTGSRSRSRTASASPGRSRCRRFVRARASCPTSGSSALVERHFDLRPASIIDALDLRRPIYQQTAAYGHFGREDLDVPWERTDKAALLAADAGLPEPQLAVAATA